MELEIAGSFIIAFAIPVFIGLLIGTAFLLWGARLAGIGNRTFGKALGTTALSCIASSVLLLVLRVVPVIGTVFGFIGGFLIAVLIMMRIYSTSFGKALKAIMIAEILTLVVVGGIMLLGFAMGMTLVAL